MSQPNSIKAEIITLLPSLRAFARSLTRNAPDADDLVQDTLVKAYGNLDKFTPGTALRQWLFTIMRNTFNTEYRRRCRETVGLDESFVERAGMTAPQEWAVRRGELRSALGRIPPRSLRTLLLVAMGVSYIDTARLSACEIGTVKSRVNRARKMLEDQIGRPGAF